MEKLRDVEKFCHFIWYEYLVEHNYGMVGEYADEKVSVIGTGRHEVSRNLQEFVSSFEEEEHGWTGKFVIENEWYQATEAAPGLYIVIGEIQTKEDAEDRIVYDFSFRFTMVVREDGESYKVLHLHQSVPDYNQSSDEFFPKRIIEQSNEMLKKKIEQRTRELEESHKKVIHYSHYDFLTDLMNRYYMEEQVEQAMKDYPYGAMIMLDIDNYKRINDSYGHPVGDEVLKMIAAALKGVFTGCLTGRVGGDEFLIYVPDHQIPRQKIKCLMEQFFEEWREHQKKLRLEFEVTVSAGAGWYPEHGVDYQSLWSKVDKVLYQMKDSGKNGILVMEK